MGRKSRTSSLLRWRLRGAASRRRGLALQPRAEALEVRELPAAVVEYPIPTSNANVSHITTGPDGNLWFTEHGPNGFVGSIAGKIGRITPAGTITEFTLGVNQVPYGIVAARGSLWFTDEVTGAIGKLTTAGVATETLIGSSATTSIDPRGITVGPDGNLWFAEYGANKIGVLDPSTGKLVAEYQTSGMSGPGEIVAGPDGNLWFTESVSTLQGKQPGIGRITTSGQFLTSLFLPIPAGTMGGGFDTPVDLVTGPDGNVWITSALGQIDRVTPSGTFTAFAVPEAASGSGAVLGGIAVGADKNLYFADICGAAIDQITASGTITKITLADSSSAPFGITSGPDGNIWFTDQKLVQNQVGKLTLAGSSTPPPGGPTTPPGGGGGSGGGSGGGGSTGGGSGGGGNIGGGSGGGTTTTPPPAKPPTSPGSSTSPPRVVSMQVTHPRRKPIQVVFRFDQALRTRPAVAPSSFVLGVPTQAGTSVRIARAGYNAGAHAITVMIAPARKTTLAGTVSLTLLAARFANARGQVLDGNADGNGGDNFVAIVALG